MSIKRYPSLLIILHWVLAIAFIGLLSVGLVMTNVELSQSLKFKLYQWHKAFGLIVLAIVCLRIVCRLWAILPALPQHFSATDKKLAKFGHYALYFFMLSMPISGWVMASASKYQIPLDIFGLFTWPKVPGITKNEVIAGAANQAHEIMAYILILVLMAHIGAVILHYFRDKTNLLTRMWFK